MTIDFKAALAYPYRSENRRDCIWIPGLFLAAGFIVFFVLGLIMAALEPAANNPPQVTDPGDFLEALRDHSEESPVSSLLEFLFNLATNILSLGYLWHLTGQWRAHGANAPAVSWLERLPRIGLDGLKMFLYGIVIGILLAVPITIVVIGFTFLFAGSLALMQQSLAPGAVAVFLVVVGALGALLSVWLLGGPLYFAPVLYAATSRKLGDLFAWPHALRFIWPRYKDGIKAAVFVIGLNLLYWAGMILSLIPCCIGILAWPFVMFAAQISGSHLLFQGLAPEAEVAGGSASSRNQSASA